MCQKKFSFLIKDAQYIGDHIIVGKCVFIQCCVLLIFFFFYYASCKQYHPCVSAVIGLVNPGVVVNHGLSAWRVLILKGCNM